MPRAQEQAPVASGIDFSAGRPSVQAMRDAGKSFVVRYVSVGEHAKEITADEAAFWRAAGINIAIVSESTANRALDGRGAGITDATIGRLDVVKAGGPADGGVIYFAVDVDTVNDDQRANVVQYLFGAASVLGWDQVGVYGEYDVMVYVALHTPCRWFWQTYAWSHGFVYGNANLFQYQNGQKLGGVDVDLNVAYTPNYGQWFYTPTEDNVPLTPDDLMNIRKEVITALNDPTHAYLQDELKPIKDALSTVQDRLGAIESKMGQPATGTLHVTGDLNVT